MDISFDEKCDEKSNDLNDSKLEVKQERLPFQMLGSSDSRNPNKKRKLKSSPGPRNAKIIKTKENSFQDSIEKQLPDNQESKRIAENGDIEIIKEVSNKSDTIKNEEKIKNYKTTPGKSRSKKQTPKSQFNTLTKFLKKVDNKDKSKQPNNISHSEDQENNSDNDISIISDSEESKNVNKNSSVSKLDLKEIDEEVEYTSSINNDEENRNVESTEEVDILNTSTASEKNYNALDKSSQDESIIIDKTIDSQSDSDISDDDDDECTKSSNESKDTDCNKSGTDIDQKWKSLPNCSVQLKKLTPKQHQKKLEMQKRRDMRERQRKEKEQKLSEEREKRKQEKETKKREREEKQKAIVEQKKKEKEEKELKKQAENEQKQREKEMKEEERRKREEEKKKKEDEKLEAERKKQKAASTFVSFFQKKNVDVKPAEKTSVARKSIFMPFEIKPDMRVAPVSRNNLQQDEKSKLDSLMQANSMSITELYLSDIKNGKYVPKKCGMTWPFEGKDIVIIDEEEDNNVNIVQPANISNIKRRKKLFSFDENRRPPYWRTWCKKSKFVKPRKPFEKDEALLDYDYDSDEDWETEEEGESIRGSDDDKDEEAEDDDYEVDNEFFVPHGYLSEEEAQGDEESPENLSSETQKVKLKILGEQFEAERKAKTLKLKPKIIGCIWMNADRKYPDETPSCIKQILEARTAWVREIPLNLTPPADVETQNSDNPQTKGTTPMSAKMAKFLEEKVPSLIRLLHGNIHNRKFLVKEFLAYLNKETGEDAPISEAKLAKKIKELGSWMSCPDEGPMYKKNCWYVSEEIRLKYLPTETLNLPNSWSYILTPKRKKADVIEEKDDESEKEKDKTKDKKRPNTPLITQFAKVMTPENMKKQLLDKCSPSTSSKGGLLSQGISASKIQSPSTSSGQSPSTPQGIRLPKRVALITLPRCDNPHKPPRISLLDKFQKEESPTNVPLSEKKSQEKNEKMVVEEENLSNPVLLNVTNEAGNKADIMIIDEEPSKA